MIPATEKFDEKFTKFVIWVTKNIEWMITSLISCEYFLNMSGGWEDSSRSTIHLCRNFHIHHHLHYVKPVFQHASLENVGSSLYLESQTETQCLLLLCYHWGTDLPSPLLQVPATWIHLSNMLLMSALTRHFCLPTCSGPLHTFEVEFQAIMLHKQSYASIKNPNVILSSTREDATATSQIWRQLKEFEPQSKRVMATEQTCEATEKHERVCYKDFSPKFSSAGRIVVSVCQRNLQVSF